MKAISTIALLLLLSKPAYAIECRSGDSQTAAERATELTAADSLDPVHDVEILACLARAAQDAQDTIEGLRAGALPFKAIRYEVLEADGDK